MNLRNIRSSTTYHPALVQKLTGIAVTRTRTPWLLALWTPMGTLLLFLMLLLTTPALAQPTDGISSSARHTGDTPIVVTEALPELQVQLGCQEPPAISASQQFTLYENGTPVHLLGMVEPMPFYPDTQIIFLFDLVEGSERLLPEFVDFLNRFLVFYSKSSYSVTTNQFAAYMPAMDGKMLVQINDFSPQVADLIKGLNHAVVQAPPKTALATLLKNASDEFYQGKPIRRTIVLFSDGLDKKTEDDLPAVLTALREQQIVVYPIFIPTTQYGKPENLQRIAAVTGGQTLTISQQDAVDALLQMLVKPDYRCTLRYRTTTLQPIHLAVQEAISDTIVTTTSVDVPAISVSPPKVMIDPTPFLTDIVKGAKQDTVPLLINVQWEFPDFKARQARVIAYTLSNVSGPPMVATKVITQNVSADQFVLDVPAVGHYNLEVAVEDEFSVRGRQNIPFAIVAPTLMPTPLPTPTAMATVTPTATLTEFGKIDEQIATTVKFSSLFFSASTLLLLAILIPLFVWLVRVLTQQSERHDRSASPGAPKPVTALLYRLQSRPEFPLRQVVPLHEDLVKLPDALLVPANPTVHAKNLEKIHDLTNFHVRIQKRGLSHYELIYIDETTALVKLHSEGMIEDLPTDRPTRLNDQNIIQLGQVQYRFIDLVNKNQNGFYPTNVTTPPQRATP